MPPNVRRLLIKRRQQRLVESLYDYQDVEDEITAFERESGRAVPDVLNTKEWIREWHRAPLRPRPNTSEGFR
jgi:hypothetical protein